MLKEILSSVAPFLGNMIGGPLGAAASRVIGQVLLGDENASESAIETALAGASPEQLTALKLADMQYRAQMAELGIDEQKIAAMDRDSARKREMYLQDRMPAILSILLTGGFFSVLLLLIFYPITNTMQGVLEVMLGALGTAWISSITYYFGSSQGSSLKTRLMAEK